MGYCPLGETNSASITKMLLDLVFGHNLSCRGQSYDGAAVMAGHSSGVQTRLRELEPKVLFTVCNAHALNLAVVDACKTVYVRNMFGTLQTLHMFFNGTKRQAVLEHCKQESNFLSAHAKQHRLQSL